MAENDLNAKEVEQDIIYDIFEEGKIQDEQGSMEASVKPAADSHIAKDHFADPAVRHAVDEAADKDVEIRETVGTDDEGHQSASIAEKVEGDDGQL